jgi:hypothetical protein
VCSRTLLESFLTTIYRKLPKRENSLTYLLHVVEHAHPTTPATAL